MPPISWAGSFANILSARSNSDCKDHHSKIHGHRSKASAVCARRINAS